MGFELGWYPKNEGGDALARTAPRGTSGHPGFRPGFVPSRRLVFLLAANIPGSSRGWPLDQNKPAWRSHACGTRPNPRRNHSPPQHPPRPRTMARMSPCRTSAISSAFTFSMLARCRGEALQPEITFSRLPGPRARFSAMKQSGTRRGAPCPRHSNHRAPDAKTARWRQDRRHVLPRPGTGPRFAAGPAPPPGRETR